MNKKLGLIVGALLASAIPQMAMADCSDISRSALESAASAALATANTAGNYHGLGFNMWVTMVDTSGKVCHVVYTGTDGATAGNEGWLGSRVISAQKANTANAFSTDDLALSTANLWKAVQPGGSLYGLQHSNPVDATKAYQGSPNNYGKNSDFLKNKRIGGVNVFGGGLALYNSGGTKVGAIGVSGDTSCADHSFAWIVRENLTGFTSANVPGGVDANGKDGLILDDSYGFGHASCGFGEVVGDAGITAAPAP